MLKIYFYLIVIISFTSNVVAQNLETSANVDPMSESWRFTYFRELEGKGIRCLEKDLSGNYWLGFNEGVICYDGYNFKYFKKKEGLKGKNVSDILIVGKKVYAVSSSGIYVFENNFWNIFYENKNGTTLLYKSLQLLSDGTICCITDKGLLLFGPVENLFLSPVKNIQIDSVRSIYFSAKKDFLNISDIVEYKPGEIWVGISYDESGEILSISTANLKNKNIQPIHISEKSNSQFGEGQQFLKSSDGSIWVINNSCKVGVNFYNGKYWTNIKVGARFGGDEYCTSISQSSSGNIWIGALGKIYSLNNGNWKVYKAPEFNIPGSQILLFPQNDDKLWILGLQTKLFWVDLSYTNWVSYNNLNYQLTEHNGAIWFLDKEGNAVQKNGNYYKKFTVKDGMIDSPVKLICTKGGKILAAGSHMGSSAIACFSNLHWEKQIYPMLSWGIDDRSVFEDSKGSLWVGGSVDHDHRKFQKGGIIQIVNPFEKNQNIIQHEFLKNGLSRSSIYGIAESADKRIWIGGGKLLYYRKTWQGFKNENFQQFINTVHGDSKNNIYVGSRHYGMYLFNGKSWSHYHSANGLSSNTIISITTDSAGHIYAVTDEGISYFDGKQWINDVFPAAMNMTHEGGNILLDSNNGNIWINKSSREWKRRAYINTIDKDGLNTEFKTYCYIPDKHPPVTNISSIPKDVEKNENVIIAWTGQDYLGKTPKNKLQFSYKLGDGKWSVYTNENYHVFNNLEPGKYNFKVKCRDLDFNEDLSPASIEFNVLLPFWQRPWFIVLVIIFILFYLVIQTVILKKNAILKKLYNKMEVANRVLRENNQKIAQQNKVIMQNQIEQQAKNILLENKNAEIEKQRDELQVLVHEIEVLSTSRESFFTNLTHELKTPLTLIHGPIGLLQSASVSKDDKEKLYSIVFNNIDRLQRLIEQLLEIKNIQTGDSDLKLESIYLPEFIDSIQNTFKSLAMDKSIDFKSILTSVQDLIFADRDKVEKIIYNLLSNAIKYTPTHGRIQLTIDIETEPIHKMNIRVVDTGNGISEEQVNLILSKSNCSSLPKNIRSFESSGIGLQYIRQLTHALSGTFLISSSIGEGTEVIISFPLNTNFNSVNANIVPQLPLNSIGDQECGKALIENFELHIRDVEKNKTILIVEDNLEMQSFLKSLLYKDYNLLIADNGEDALKISQSHELDLIVSDILMPVMDGLQLCSTLKSNIATSHIPILLLTSRNREEQMILGYEAGADGYIGKPFNSKLLLMKVNRILENKFIWQKKVSKDLKLKPSEIKVTSIEDKFMERLMQVMEEHVSDSEFDMDKMADKLNLSHVQFIRKVKQLTAKKPIDLLKSFRMQRAKDLLDNSKISISEISYMVGYDLPNSFSRAFRKEYNVSPTEYLEQKNVKNITVELGS